MALEPLGKGFISLVKMVVGPIIFLTVVVGIASIAGFRRDLRALVTMLDKHVEREE